MYVVIVIVTVTVIVITQYSYFIRSTQCSVLNDIVLIPGYSYQIHSGSAHLLPVLPVFVRAHLQLTHGSAKPGGSCACDTIHGMLARLLREIARELEEHEIQIWKANNKCMHHKRQQKA